MEQFGNKTMSIILPRYCNGKGVKHIEQYIAAIRYKPI